MNNVLYARDFREIDSRVVTVTPELAGQWLEFNKNNRNASKATVIQYAKDMRAGNWRLTHQGIAFCDDGTLADGQQRLMAVVESGVSVRMMVTTGLPRESMRSMDNGRIRLPHDNIRIAGGIDWLDQSAIAIVRLLMSNMSGLGKYSVDEIEAYARKHEESIRFAVELVVTHKKNLTAAPILASYAAAVMNGENSGRVKRFSEVMHDGVARSESENAAIRLRDYLMTNVDCSRGAGKRLATAKRTQRAIYLFCRETPIKKLFEPKEVVYQTA